MDPEAAPLDLLLSEGLSQLGWRDQAGLQEDFANSRHTCAPSGADEALTLSGSARIDQATVFATTALEPGMPFRPRPHWSLGASVFTRSLTIRPHA